MKSFAKLLFRLVFMPSIFTVVFMPTPALGQQTTSNLASACLFCPTMRLEIINGTDDQAFVVPIVDGTVGSDVKTNGYPFMMNFGVTRGEMSVVLQVCKELDYQHATDFAPIWAQNRNEFGADALGDVNDKTSLKEIKRRVENIKKSLRDYPGGKVKERELDNWYKRVKHNGVNLSGVQCRSPRVLPVKTYGWNYGYSQLHIIQLTVRGDEERGYRIDPPQYAGY